MVVRRVWIGIQLNVNMVAGSLYTSKNLIV